MTDSLPTLKMRPNKSPKQIRFGAPWVYENELVLDRRARKIPAGSLAELVGADGVFVATIAVNTASKITGRVLARAKMDEISQEWLDAKLLAAAELRNRLYPQPFYRLVHAEADGLPGVVIDRFGDVFVIQPNAAWADTRLDMFVDALTRLFGAKSVVKNASSRARAHEGLNDEGAILHGSIDGPIEVPMNGAVYLADLLEGQKTGLFFDQRDNHAFAAKLAKGARVLDVFSHVGGFGLAALAGGAASALCVDGSGPALDLAKRGAEASGFGDRFETRQGDAFSAMQDLREAGQRFDLVVCDPPAFAPARPSLVAGLRAYEKVARAAADLVEQGGYLALCSCSHAADLTKFRDASLRGVGRAGRVAQIIHTGAAGADHPVHAHLAESSYLKAIFLRLN